VCVCVCVCVCLSVCLHIPRRMPTLLHAPGCNLGNGKECPLVVHFWADLQSVHEFVAMTSQRRTRNVSECLYSLCAWFDLYWFILLYKSCTAIHSKSAKIEETKCGLIVVSCTSSTIFRRKQTCKSFCGVFKGPFTTLRHFWATVSKTVRRMLSVHCLCCLSVCDVGVSRPNGRPSQLLLSTCFVADVNGP